MEDSLLRFGIVRFNLTKSIGIEDEQKYRAIVTHREACHLLARHAIADKDTFIPGPIAFDLESRDGVA